MNSRLGQITIFQDTFRMLSENIQAWGANANVAAVEPKVRFAPDLYDWIDILFPRPAPS